MPRFHTVAPALLALLATPAPVRAQLRLSEAATVSQTVDGTRITIEYSRPRARGRTSEQIWGKEVPWDTVWTPGANMATTLELSRGVTVGGRSVPRGRYSVWTVPRRTGDWTIILEPDARRYHADVPPSSAAQITFPARASDAPFAEVLSWSFPLLTLDSATVAMQWLSKRIEFTLAVQPSSSAVVSEADAAAFVGDYDVSCNAALWELCRGAPADWSGGVHLALAREHGRLVARIRGERENPNPFTLVRIEPGRFVYGVCCPDRDGDVIAEVREWLELSFQVRDGRATGFEAFNYKGTRFLSATRAR